MSEQQTPTQDLLSFFNDWIIDSVPPTPFGKIAEPWQISRLKDKENWLNFICGIPGYTKPTTPKLWLEVAPRGHDKTSYIGRLLLWLLLNAKRKLSLVAAAADTDQANILKQRMQTEAALNKVELTFQSKKVVSKTGSVLEIVSSDAPSAYGRLDDVVVMDELTHWYSQDLFSALFSGIIKRPDCICLIITNAGYVGTWQHELLLSARESKDWIVTELPFCASWMQAQLPVIQKFIPQLEARRVLFNEWVSTSSGISVDDVKACLIPPDQKIPEPKGDVVISLDYGPKFDRTAVCVCSFSESIVVHELLVWEGTPQNPVSLDMLLATLVRLYAKYNANNPIIVVDPYQTMGLVQQAKSLYDLPIEEFNFSVNNITAMLTTLRTMVENHQLRIPSEAGRAEDGSTAWQELAFDVMFVKNSSWGYKLVTNKNKHDDRVVALGMAILTLVRRAAKKRNTNLISEDLFSNFKPQEPKFLYGIPEMPND